MANTVKEKTRLFQIRKKSTNIGKIYHFEASATATDAAIRLLAEKQANRREIVEGNSVLHTRPQKPCRVLRVVEMNTETKQARRRGLKFDLDFCYIAFTYTNGDNHVDRWYKARIRGREDANGSQTAH